MAPVLNPTVVRLVSEGRLDGQVVQNVTHWALKTGEWAVPALSSLVGAYASWLSVHLSLYTSNNMTWTAFRAQQMAGEDGLRYESVLPSPIGGQVNNGSLPNNVALCATVLTAYAGKSGRGRIYLAGIPVQTVTRSRVAQAHIDNLNSALEQLTTGSEFEDYNLGVYSTQYQGNPRLTGMFRVATSVAIRNDVLDSQRRRLPDRGV